MFLSVSGHLVCDGAIIGGLMKAFLTVILTLTAVSAQAVLLESHYGKVSRRGHVYTCHFTNRTNHTLDMKYVEFLFLRIGGHGDAEFTVRERIDYRVQPGNSVSYSVRPNFVQSVYHCKYISR